jgi:hypothetical protein
MTPDQLDDYFERARLEGESSAVPDGFTDRVMRAVRVQPSAPVWADPLPGTIASSALILAGVVLLSVSPENTVAAGVLLALGLLLVMAR